MDIVGSDCAKKPARSSELAGDVTSEAVRGHGHRLERARRHRVGGRREQYAAVYKGASSQETMIDPGQCLLIDLQIAQFNTGTNIVFTTPYHAELPPAA